MIFFAVTKAARGALELQRVRVEQDVQVQLTELFDEQRAEFNGIDVNPIAFSPTYRIQSADREVFAIENFELPDFLQEAIDAHQGIDDLVAPFTEAAPQVKALVGIDVDASAFYFQFFERKRILDSRYLLIFRGNTFNSIDEPAVQVDNHLSATIVDGTLRFKSFHRVRQFLDLSGIFNEATDDAIRQVLDHPKLLVENPDVLVAGMSSRLRKRFATLIATGILDNEEVTVQLIQRRAARYSNLDGLQTRGPANARRLVLPPEKARLEKLLRFMCEELFLGDLTGREKLANSSRVVETVAD